MMALMIMSLILLVLLSLSLCVIGTNSTKHVKKDSKAFKKMMGLIYASRYKKEGEKLWE